MSELQGNLKIMKEACDKWLATQKIFFVLYKYRSQYLENNTEVHDIMPIIGEPRVDENGDCTILTLLGNKRSLKKGSFEIFTTREAAKKRYTEIITSHCSTIRGGD